MARLIILFAISIVLLVVGGIAPSVNWTWRLCSLAELRLKEIPTNFSHKSFYDNKWKFWKYCPTCVEIAENLARGHGSTSSAIQAWWSSPPHRINLQKKWRFTCLRNNTVNGENFYIQVFGR